MSSARIEKGRPPVIRSLYFILIAAIIVLCAFGAYYWWSHQPVPLKISVRFSSPTATKLEKDAEIDSLKVRFSGSAARLEDIGKPVKGGITMSPPLKGEWLWENEARLVFSPAEDWGVGTNYTVNFDKSLFPQHLLLENYNKSFLSANFTQELYSSDFYLDPKDPKIKRAVYELCYSHPVDPVELEKRLELIVTDSHGKPVISDGDDNGAYPFTASYDDFHGRAYIKSEPIPIPPLEMSMRLTVKPGVVSSRGGSGAQGVTGAKVKVPGIYSMLKVDSFNLMLIRNEDNEPEQVLSVSTTDGVRSADLAAKITAYILPKDRPKTPSRNSVRTDYHWYDTRDVGPETLALSRPVKLRSIPSSEEFPTEHNFSYTAEPGKYLYVLVGDEIESRAGYILDNAYDGIRTVPDFPKEIEIMHDGALLSLSGEKQLSVMTRGVEAVRFEAGRLLPGQISHLVSQTGGNIKSPYFNNYYFNEDNMARVFRKVRRLERQSPEKAQYTSFDFSKLLTAGEGEGVFFFKVESWDPVRERPTGRADTRLILITDLGILVKNGADNSHNIFVQSLHKGTPVVGATVSVLGKNGLPVITKKTSKSGHVRFPDLKDFKREKQPTVYLVTKGDDRSFIPYERRDTGLNLSRFDTGGLYSSPDKDSLNAYLFSDRGIYRPGDEFHVAMIIKAPSWSKDIEGAPLEYLLSDPRGRTLIKKKIRLSKDGFEEVRYRTDATSPTGNYEVKVYIVKDRYRRSLIGSETVRVEEFIPDRLKITTKFSKLRAEGWVTPVGLTGEVLLKNLFGRPATKRRVTGSIKYSPAYPSFRAHKGYKFFDPLRAKQSFTERLNDQETDEEGNASFDLFLDRFTEATYRVNFTAEGFEADGGRGVLSTSTILVSPLNFLVGYKADGELSYIKKGVERKVDFISVDPALKKVASTGLWVRLVENRFVSALVRQPSGLYQYQSVEKKIPLGEFPFEIDAKGTPYLLPTNEPGDYSLLIADGKGTEISRVDYSVVGEANLTRSLEKNAELKIKLDKKDYSPGEEIEISITAPYTGAGLITIERDDVYAHKWFKTDKTSTVKKIRLPKGLEGNGYVNVSFVRSADSKEIFMSPLSYGVIPFTIKRAERDIRVRIETPELVRPGESMEIKYKAEKAGKVVVFAIDEGILAGRKLQDARPACTLFQETGLAGYYLSNIRPTAS